MRKFTLSVVLLLVMLGFAIHPTNAQTASGSDYLVAQPIPDQTVLFDVSSVGVSTPVLWGLDTAWAWDVNFKRGSLYMGANNVDVARVSFTPSDSITGDTLSAAQKSALDWRLSIVNNYANANTKIAMNDDPSTLSSWYSGNAAHWEKLLNVTTKYIQNTGRTVVSVAPFNEPDNASTGQGTITDFYNICTLIKQDTLFNNIRISGGNTLNCDSALYWYNYLRPAGVNEGNTHQLAGSFDNYANFFQTVKANGDYATSDELHNVMEAMVGANYGMQTGIWWGAAELARADFCKDTHGVRLGYAEDRPNWTAASVYRGPNGNVQAFTGGSERQAVATTYRFVSTDRDVYYDGYGPQREFTITQPGGNGYQVNQPSGERVINITWGTDIQPAINGTYILVNRNSGKVMEAAGGGLTNGTNIDQATYTGATYQQWKVTPVDSHVGGDFSYFKITPVSDDTMALDNYNNSLWGDGGNLDQWGSNNGAGQQWYLEYAGDGWFYIHNRWNTQCVDVDNASTADGANIFQWTKNGGNNQQWRFIPVGAAVEFNAPSTPTNLVATGNAESVKLTWTASPESDVAGYTILRSDSSSIGPFNTIARNVTTTAYVDNTATIPGQYYYEIKAVDKSLNSSAYTSVVSATTTGANDLVADYQFEGNTKDSTINLNNAATYGTISYVAGKVGSNAISLNGTDAFVQLPATVADQQSITIAAWVYWNGGNSWQRIFDFGNSESQYMFLTPSSGTGTLHFGIKNGGAEQYLDAPALPMGEWTHVTVTLDATGATMYENGVQVAQSSAITISPMDFKPVLNYIGRSQWPDPLFNGSIDNFQIYNYALSASQVSTLASAAGPVNGHIYYIQSKLSGKVLQVSHNGTTNGSLIVQYTNHGSSDEQWLFQENSDGTWTLFPQNTTGKVLDVPNCNFVNGNQLEIYDSWNNDCQKYHFVDMGNGYYQIQVKDSTKCLDVYNNSLANSATVDLWDFHNGDNQLWKIIDVATGVPLKVSTDVQNVNTSHLSISPIPANSNLHVNYTSTNDNGLSNVTVIDMNGRVVLSQNINSDAQLNVSNLASGIYMLKLTNDKESLIKKLIIQH